MSAIRKALVARFHQGWWFSATGWKSATDRHESVSEIDSMKTRSINSWQHRLKREHPTGTERNRSSKSADGRVATVATAARKSLVQRKEKRTLLTPTGLLMEGDYTN